MYMYVILASFTALLGVSNHSSQSPPLHPLLQVFFFKI